VSVPGRPAEAPPDAARAAGPAAGGEAGPPGSHPRVRPHPAKGWLGGRPAARRGPRTTPRFGRRPATLATMAPIDAAERARLLAELAAQQASQREQHVTELADLHTRVRAARTELAAAEAAYRAAWRRAITTGLLTAAQLRTLGLPAPDAHRRPRPPPPPPPAPAPDPANTPPNQPQ
jgi:hypothetical protein